MTDLHDLYQQVILDHNRSPRNFRELPDCSHHAEGYNPLCGDQLALYVHVENDVIKDISFKGSGCAISTASASLMTEALKGKTTQDAEILFNKIHHMLTGEAVAADEIGKLQVLSGVNAFPMRVKCATLAWHTMKNALEQSETMATTE